MSGDKLDDFLIPVKLKLSALWASVMFCFIYADFFGLFLPGKLMTMNAGIIGPLGTATPAILLGVSVMLAIPSTMVCLSLLLPSALCRWANIVLGVLYIAITTLTSLRAPPFYMFFAAVEIAMMVMIVFYAVKWPKIIS